jgi:hypothetical protein
MPNITVKSTLFLKELQNRRRSFTGRRIAIKIIAPPELRWWYWLEFGTANLGVTGGYTYPIDPHNPPTALRWFDGGTPVVRSHVDHPGIRPRAFVRKAIPQIRQDSLQQVYAAIQEVGFRYSAFKKAFNEETGNMVVDDIVQSLGNETNQTPRSDTGAKIPGSTAAGFFLEHAVVEIVTE